MDTYWIPLAEYCGLLAELTLPVWTASVIYVIPTLCQLDIGSGSPCLVSCVLLVTVAGLSCLEVATLALRGRSSFCIELIALAAPSFSLGANENHKFNSILV